MTILMGSENPTGHKLEDLLELIVMEVLNKSAKIEGDGRPVARQVLRNNQQIVALLLQAKALQQSSYDILALLGPNEGPLGKPRIGEGS